MSIFKLIISTACEAIPSIDYGEYWTSIDSLDRLQDGLLLSGDVLYFKCNGNHTLKNGNFSDFRIECLNNGSWSFTEEPSCITRE